MVGRGSVAAVRCGRGLQGQLISQYHLPLSPGQIINLPITSHRPADDAQITRCGQLKGEGVIGVSGGISGGGGVIMEECKCWWGCNT